MVEFPEAQRVVVPDLLEQRAQQRPDAVFAVFDDGSSWTFADTAARAWHVASSLIPLGARRRDVIAAWLPNGPEALVSWVGTNAAGCTYSPVNTGYKGRLLENAINLLECSILIANHELVPRLHGLDLPHLRMIVVVGDGAPEPPPGVHMITWDELLTHGVPARPALDEPIEAWEDAVILFTSGTTGPSKAVRRPYLLYDTMAKVAFDAPGVDGDDRFFVCGPMFHGGADVPIYSMLRAGGSVCVVNGFRTPEFWSQVRRWKCTVAWVHSAMSIFLAKAPERDDDGDNPLRLAMLAPMFPAMHDFAKRFDTRLYSVYGMTELPCPFGVVDPDDHRSLGAAHPGFEVRLVDDHDREVEVGQPGELIVRHEQPWALTPGYFNNDEATARLWRNGWLHTGDVFVRDAAGHYSLVDRVKDSIRRRGENVSSIEVENEILEYDDVLEAAVFAVPSDIEEDVMAAVVPQPGTQIEPAALVEFLVDRLPHFAVPRYIDVVAELPRTPSLRVDKTVLRARGVNSATWDRDAAGVVLKRERL